jgi:hypothetical protein
VAELPEFPLKIGVASFPVTHEGEPERTQIVRYEADVDRDYDIVPTTDVQRDTAGTGRVRQAADQTFFVTPNFRLGSPDSVFWAAFDVDDQGIARLQRIYLTVRDPDDRAGNP